MADVNESGAPHAVLPAGLSGRIDAVDYANTGKLVYGRLSAALTQGQLQPDARLKIRDLAEAMGQHELTARLLGAVEAVDTSGYRLKPDDRNEYNHLADAACMHLGAVAFDAAWTQGRASPFEQVVEEAVSILEATLAVRGQLAPT